MNLSYGFFNAVKKPILIIIHFYIYWQFTILYKKIFDFWALCICKRFK